MLATSRNEPLSAVSAPFHDAFPRRNDIDRMHSFAGQARRFSDDGSVFSFDDHDFGCPLKRKDNSIALVPPPFSLIEALSWSPFDDGYDDNHDGEGSSTAFPTLSANVPTKARMDTESNESTTAHSSQEKQELQKALVAVEPVDLSPSPPPRVEPRHMITRRMRAIKQMFFFSKSRSSPPYSRRRLMAWLQGQQTD
jgi:hypothetical protein